MHLASEQAECRICAVGENSCCANANVGSFDSYTQNLLGQSNPRCDETCEQESDNDA